MTYIDIPNRNAWTCKGEVVNSILELYVPLKRDVYVVHYVFMPDKKVDQFLETPEFLIFNPN